MGVLAAALDASRVWPLTVTHNLGERIGPDQQKHTGWQLHIRCARAACGQSVFCAGNDSGPYTWTLGSDVQPALIAHIFQCHRAELELNEEIAA